jgi:lipopolysaccharide export system permease protein
MQDMLGTIDAYILRRITVVTLAAVAVTTGIALTTQILLRINLLAATGQSLLTVGKLAGLLIPSMVVVALPFAILIGVMTALRGLNQDNELAVMEAAGVGIWRRARPALIVGVAGALIVAAFGLWLQPQAAKGIRQLIATASGDLLSSAVVSGTFTQIEPGLLIQIAERRTNGEFGGIFISDSRNKDEEIVYIAKSGALLTTAETALLYFRDGFVQRRNPADGSITTIRFDAYSLDAGTFSKVGEGRLRISERETLQLMNPDPQDEAFQKNPNAFQREIHRRFSDPLYPPAMALVALFATVAARSNRQNGGTLLVIAAATGVGLRAIGLAIVDGMAPTPFAVVLYYAFPVAIIVFFALAIAGRIKMNWVEAGAERLAEQAARLATFAGWRRNSTP